MMYLLKNRDYFPTMFIFIITLLIGVILQNKFIGTFLCIIPAFLALNSIYSGIGMLLIFIPLRPLLITYNTGFTVLGDLIIVALFTATILNNRKQLASFHFFEIGFFIYIFIGLLAGFLGDVYIAAIIMQARAMMSFFLLYIMIKKMPYFQSYIPFYSWTSILVGLLLSIQGIVEKLSHRTMFIPKEWQEMMLSQTNKERIYGLLKGPNELAIYMIIITFITYYLYKQATTAFEKKVLFSIMVLFFTIFLLTQSRGTFLAVFLFGAIAILLYRKTFPYKTFFTVVLISMALSSCVQWASNSGTTKRFTHSFSEEQVESSLQDGRLYYIKRGIEAFKDNPLIGHGFGSFGDSGSKSYKSPIVDTYQLNPSFYSDNQYIQVLVETGLIGTIGFLTFLIGMGFIVWRQRENSLLVFLYVSGIFLGLIYNVWEMDVFALFYFGLLGFEAQRYSYKKVIPAVYR
ncbi:MAG: O-antigen ligase family protein [Bacillaceae bacterium]